MEDFVKQERLTVRGNKQLKSDPAIEADLKNRINNSQHGRFKKECTLGNHDDMTNHREAPVKFLSGSVVKFRTSWIPAVTI